MLGLAIPVSPTVLAVLTRLDRLRGAWSAHSGVAGDRAARLRGANEIQSAAASCRLSGIRLSDAEVAGILRGDSLPLEDGPAVRGYVAAMRHPLPPADSLLDAETIRRLHATLLGGGPDAEPSPWRTCRLTRETFDDHGQAKGRTSATLPPHLIESKLDDLLTWLEFELRTGEQHAVLVIGVFILGLTIASPFEGGNTRLSRLLIGRLLERVGYGFLPYASVERQIEELRDRYHDAYDLSHARFWSGEADLAPWLEFFAEVLNRQQERVETKQALEVEATGLSPLQRTILDSVREHGTVDAGLLLEATGANRNTLKDNLSRMVRRGVLEKSGQRRGTRYRLASADPLRG